MFRPLMLLPLLALPALAAEPTVTKLDVPAKSILPCARWADAKGDEVWLLDSDGVLMKVAVATGKVSDKKDFGKKVAWLDESAEGLIVTSTDKNEIWVLDGKLEVKKTISVPKLGQAASSPKLSFAVVGALKAPDPLQVVDLKTGKATTVTTDDKKYGKFLGNAPAVSPDGLNAYTADGDDMIRFDVKDGKLTPAEKVRAGSNPHRISVSPDGKFVCRPSGNGNPDVKPNYSVAIYHSDALSKQECVVTIGSPPGAFGIDAAGQKVYAAAGKSNLTAFTLGGVKKGEYKVGGKEKPLQYLASPAGNKVLLVAKDQVNFVEVPKE